MGETTNEEEKFEIKKHDFEENINHLKTFSEQNNADLEIKKVNSSKGVGEWFAEYFKGGGIGKDHKVTGDELNEVTTQIHKNLSVIRDNQIQTKAEFGRVYSALKSLDKDYIQAILIAVEGNRKTNKKLEESQEVIKSNQKNIKTAQEDIEKAHNTLVKTVQQLQKFKEKLDQYKHMADIDKMWTDIQNYANDIATYKNRIDVFGKFKKEIEKSKHLSDIDKIWDDVKKNQDNLKNVNTEVSGLTKKMNVQEESVNALNETRNLILSLEHLVDIDSMWSDINRADQDIKRISESVDELLKSLNKQIAGFEEVKKNQDKLLNQEHIFDIDSLWNDVNYSKDAINNVAKKCETASSSIDNLEIRVVSLENLKGKLDEVSHIKDIDAMFEDIIKNGKEIISLIENDIEQQKRITELEKSLNDKDDLIKEMSLSFGNKIKIAYILTGGSLGLAIIEMILLLTRMM